jgi:hypothetical protein
MAEKRDMTVISLEQAAFMIADLLKKCPTEGRGELLTLTAAHLRQNSQFYTATLIEAAAESYQVGKSVGRPH